MKRIPPSARFAAQIPGGERLSVRRRKKGERGIWQRRFWEHAIRDEGDYERHVDYIHYNPVKMQKAGCALLSRPTALVEVEKNTRSAAYCFDRFPYYLPLSTNLLNIKELLL